MPKKPKITETESGRAIPPAPHRVAYAQQKLYENSYSTVRAMIMKQFGVSKATAERDIANAQVLIAEDAERERPILRARETQRLNRIADKAEDAGEFSAAVQASRGIGKMNGLEVQVVSVGNTSPEQQAMLNALVMTPHARRRRLAELKAQLSKGTAVAASSDDEDADD